MVMVPVTVRNLGLEGYGEMAIIFLLQPLCAVFDLGFSKYLVATAHDECSRYRNFVFSLISIIGTSLLTLLLITLFLLLNPNINIGNYKISGFILICSIVVAILTAYQQIILSILEYCLKFFKMNIIYTLQTILIQSTIMIISFYSTDIKTIGASVLIAMTLQTCIATCIVISHIPKHTNIDLSKYTSTVNEAIYYLYTSLAQALHLPLIKLLIISSGNLILLGVFEIFVRIGGFALNLLNSTNFSLYGLFSNYKFDAQIRVARNITLLNICFLLLGIFLTFIFAELILNLFQVELQLKYLYIFTIGSIALSAVVEPYFKILLINKFSKSTFFIRIFTLFLTITLVLILKPSEMGYIYLYNVTLIISAVQILLIGMLSIRKTKIGNTQ